MAVTYVLFDLDGVYLSNGTHAGVERIANYFNLDREKTKQMLKSTPASPGLLLRLGEITYATFLDQFCSSLEISPNEDNKKTITDAWFGAYEYRPAMQELVVELRKNGYRTGILTNNFPERITHAEDKFHFKKYFDHVFVSSELCVRKPDSLCYQKVLNTLKLSPDNVFFTDDKKENVSAAKQLGITAVVFENEQQLRMDLKEHSIL